MIGARSERRFLAEREVCLFGKTILWWPVRDGNWRRGIGEAERDAENDRALREPLLPPKVFDLD